MVTKKRIHNIEQLQKIQAYACQSNDAVGIHSEDGTIIVDAKSYIGLFALDFTKPVLIVSEDMNFHRKIARVGDTLDFKPQFLKCEIYG